MRISKSQREPLRRSQLLYISLTLTVYNSIDDDTSFIGTIDVFDVMFYVLALYKTDKTIETQLGSVNIEDWCTDVKKLDQQTHMFATTHIEFVVGTYLEVIFLLIEYI
jgi:hypothetical protein